MLDIAVGAAPPLAADHRAPGDRLEGHLADEPPGSAGHHGGDIVTALLQPPRDLDRLIGADAARHAKSY